MTSENSDRTFSQKAKEAFSAFAASAKAAARLAAKQAERTKLSNVTLPHAYRQLGKDIHATGSFRDQFPEEFAKADELKAKIAGLRQAAPERDVESKSFKDRAKETAGKAKDAAHAKTLGVELNSVLRKLGKSAYETLGKDGGSPEVVTPIEECQHRIAVLDAEMQAIDNNAASGILTPRRLLVGVGALAAIVFLLGIIGLIVGDQRDARVAATTIDGVKAETKSDETSNKTRSPVSRSEEHAQSKNMATLNFTNWEILAPVPKNESQKAAIEAYRKQALDKEYRQGPNGESLSIKKEPYRGMGTAEISGFHNDSGQFIHHGQMLVLLRGHPAMLRLTYNGKLEGRSLYWDPGKAMAGTAMYADGDLNGEEARWYTDGQTRWRRDYRNGKRHGRAMTWDDKGRLQETSHYVDGRRDGECTYCLTAETGQPEYELVFKKGRLVRPSKADFVATIYMLNNTIGMWSANGKQYIPMKAGIVFDVFGRPATIRPTFDSPYRSWWDYPCRDGLLSFRVADQGISAGFGDDADISIECPEL